MSRVEESVTVKRSSPAVGVRADRGPCGVPGDVSFGRMELESGGPSFDSVMEALGRSGWKFRRNIITNERQVDFGDGWQIVRDDMLSVMRLHLSQKFYHMAFDKKSKETYPAAYQLMNNTTFLWPAVVASCDGNSVNPLQDWIDECRDAAKDADPALLDKWLGEVFHIDERLPEAAQRWISRRIICAIMARVMRPGTPWPRMPILYGPQGIGKSLLVRNLIPTNEKWDPYFTNEFNFGMREGKMAHAVKGKLVVECDEMRGRLKEIEEMRSFISRNIDGTGERLAYRRDPEPSPRTCIIIGTANNPDCIPKDSFGNRRYFVVPVLGKYDPKSGSGSKMCGEFVTKFMRNNRKALHGLALRALEDDFRASGVWGNMLLDDDGLTAIFEEHADRHREIDEWEESISQFVRNWEESIAELGGYFKSQELAEFCRMVKLESRAQRYESYATVCRRYHSRVRELLSGEQFGLVYVVRKVPDMGGYRVVRGWFHKESDNYRLPADFDHPRDDDRRRMLRIPLPQDLADSGSGGGLL